MVGSFFTTKVDTVSNYASPLEDKIQDEMAQAVRKRHGDVRSYCLRSAGETKDTVERWFCSCYVLVRAERGQANLLWEAQLIHRAA